MLLHHGNDMQINIVVKQIAVLTQVSVRGIISSDS